ncbi:kinase-like domain-containing protein [Cantharellus anzutake]|uniref:kinase-like domain-containing protein n=2 Tax=Cantharellus anzutake TaxID=1750568 RepID=UPI0019063A77|nr:kinase-like domain-containing protein [Cantharellus anzutake]KAF8328586.1 kinase-like domain-containing protein [Cantharellus anzutake]
MSPVDELLQNIKERLLQVDDRILDGQVAIPHNRAWSFGVIYEGTYNTEKVCIKAFRYIDRDPVSEFIHRLVREMRVWRQLTNTHIVKLHGWISYLESTEDLCPGLVSNWCDEGNVKSYLRRRQDADRQALICGIAHGLAYLHSREIVHGDIKPQNVVVSSEKTPQLCDFGLSFIISDKSTYIDATSMGQFGTWRYLAPEVCMAEEPFRNMKSDVWAFGCTAMEVRLFQRIFGSGS